MTVYTGLRLESGRCYVCRQDGRDTSPLDPREDLWNHSPDGFEWGYGGSGPAQLALALLADACEHDAVAVSLHQAFKFEQVGHWPREGWSTNDAEICRWVISKLNDIAGEIVDLSFSDGKEVNGDGG